MRAAVRARCGWLLAVGYCAHRLAILAELLVALLPPGRCARWYRKLESGLLRVGKVRCCLGMESAAAAACCARSPCMASQAAPGQRCACAGQQIDGRAAAAPCRRGGAQSRRHGCRCSGPLGVVVWHQPLTPYRRRACACSTLAGRPGVGAGVPYDLCCFFRYPCPVLL